MFGTRHDITSRSACLPIGPSRHSGGGGKGSVAEDNGKPSKVVHHSSRGAGLASLGGSLLVLVSLGFSPNLPSIVIEVFWTTISLYGVQKNLRARKQARQPKILPGEA